MGCFSLAADIHCYVFHIPFCSGGVQIEYTMAALHQGASPFKTSADSSGESSVDSSGDSLAASLDVY